LFVMVLVTAILVMLPLVLGAIFGPRKSIEKRMNKRRVRKTVFATRMGKNLR